jgi:hypothetical protein
VNFSIAVALPSVTLLLVSELVLDLLAPILADADIYAAVIEAENAELVDFAFSKLVRNFFVEEEMSFLLTVFFCLIWRGTGEEFSKLFSVEGKVHVHSKAVISVLLYPFGPKTIGIFCSNGGRFRAL